MQVILLKDVAGVGQRGSIQNVSDGYALNHLFPNKLAQLASPEAKKALEKKQAEDKAHRVEQEKYWAGIADKMKTFKLLLRVNASEQGHLYKKIAPEDIARILKEQGIELPAEAIKPKMPIKQVGTWPVELRLGSRTETINVEVMEA